MGNKESRQITEQVKEAKYFFIVFGSTVPDISHRGQTSQIIRYNYNCRKRIENYGVLFTLLKRRGKFPKKLLISYLKYCKIKR